MQVHLVVAFYLVIYYVRVATSFLLPKWVVKVDTNSHLFVVPIFTLFIWISGKKKRNKKSLFISFFVF